MIFYLIVLDLYTQKSQKCNSSVRHRSFEIGHSDKWTGANRELQTYGGWVVRKVGSCELRTTNLS